MSSRTLASEGPLPEDLTSTEGGPIITIPKIPEGYHCILSVLFYGKKSKACTVKNGLGSPIAVHESRRSINKNMLVGLDNEDGSCSIELTGVSIPEEWSPLITPNTVPIWSRLYSYTDIEGLTDKVLITIVVQAGVLPDIFDHND
jgi:hypothetical protein